ncbi:hypothetical protein PSTT_09849, partial [Puccinia striiformis]
QTDGVKLANKTHEVDFSASSDDSNSNDTSLALPQQPPLPELKKLSQLLKVTVELKASLVGWSLMMLTISLSWVTCLWLISLKLSVQFFFPFLEQE